MGERERIFCGGAREVAGEMIAEHLGRDFEEKEWKTEITGCHGDEHGDCHRRNPRSVRRAERHAEREDNKPECGHPAPFEAKCGAPYDVPRAGNDAHRAGPHDDSHHIARPHHDKHGDAHGDARGHDHRDGCCNALSDADRYAGGDARGDRPRRPPTRRPTRSPTRPEIGPTKTRVATRLRPPLPAQPSMQ